MKAISQKNKKLSSEIISIVEKELKLFYFNAFKRRSKNLLTLELIKECYADQINFFIDQILNLVSKYDNECKQKDVYTDLMIFKNHEGCNKKILETLILFLSDRYNCIEFSPRELKSLLLFED